MRFLLILSLLGSTGCASLAEKVAKLDAGDDATASDFKAVGAKTDGGTAPYTYGRSQLKAEWISCKHEGNKAAVLVMHSDKAGYKKDGFCGGWIAQTFLAQGFDVLTYNRPGYGASTGKPDFGGAASMLAGKAATAAAKMTIVGGWGYEGGAAAMGLLAKQLGNLQFLILGGGIYDYDDALKTTADAYLKQDLEALKKSGGDKGFEQRSISYDTSGFPHTMVIYHGAQDTAIKPAAAKAFADSLESSGQYQVTFQQIDGIGHEIPWIRHRKILEQLILAATGKPAST